MPFCVGHFVVSSRNCVELILLLGKDKGKLANGALVVGAARVGTGTGPLASALRAPAIAAKGCVFRRWVARSSPGQHHHQHHQQRHTRYLGPRSKNPPSPSSRPLDPTRDTTPQPRPPTASSAAAISRTRVRSVLPTSAAVVVAREKTPSAASLARPTFAERLALYLASPIQHIACPVPPRARGFQGARLAAGPARCDVHFPAALALSIRCPSSLAGRRYLSHAWARGTRRFPPFFFFSRPRKASPHPLPFFQGGRGRFFLPPLPPPRFRAPPSVNSSGRGKGEGGGAKLKVDEGASR